MVSYSKVAPSLTECSYKNTHQTCSEPSGISYFMYLLYMYQLCCRSQFGRSHLLLLCCKLLLLAAATGVCMCVNTYATHMYLCVRIYMYINVYVCYVYVHLCYTIKAFRADACPFLFVSWLAICVQLLTCHHWRACATTVHFGKF